MSREAAAELLDAMFGVAMAARKQAYVPGCNFPVGACLKGVGPALFVGANVENPVPSMSICAETSALGAMITHGERRLTDVLVIGGTLGFCPPCGGCRQRLMPFADFSTVVHLCTENGDRQSIPFHELIPLSSKS